jgi:hypothetical protein
MGLAMSRIVAFYRNEASDQLGRKLEDIWHWDYDELEDVHNYIQFLFPNWQPGVFPAPLLDDETTADFRKYDQLRQNLARSHDLMLNFYGLRYNSETMEIVPAENFIERAANWLHPHNHNHLRITRILICLMALGLPERAQAFFRCLQKLHEQYPHAISRGTLVFWENAVVQ